MDTRFAWGHININVNDLDHRLADVATCVDPGETLIELLQVYLER